MRVYPRVCGGTPQRVVIAIRPYGLSPRVRGNHEDGKITGRIMRSIPACAGEPRGNNEPWFQVRVYPRVCGGTPGVAVARQYAGGLSPRVRGNLQDFEPEVTMLRSIPACAGEPTCRRHWHYDDAVYPRVCGGTSWQLGCAGCGGGLSPRVRGNQPRVLTCGGSVRSIPACAGEPELTRCCPGRPAVYPRVCGGTPWHFDSDPCYHICQGNGTAPMPTF